MAKGKDYSAGNGKRWLIAIGLVVLVAIVVVIILICIPPNTYNAVETLNRSTQTAFLTREQEKSDYELFRKKISETQRINVYKTEVSDIKTITESVNLILNFYNDSLTFASSNKNLKNNYKPIKNNLNSARDSQKKLTKILNNLSEVAAKSQNTSTLLSNGMIDFRREYTKWLNYNKKAIEALSKAYTGSMGDTIENNKAAKLILNATNDYLSVIQKQFARLSEEDKKDNSVEDYDYKSSAVVGAFSKFVQEYVNSSASSVITSYYFDSSVQEAFAVVDKFTSLYKVKNYQKVIESAAQVGLEYEFTKTFEGVEDTEGVYQNLKAFLGGRL